MTPPLFVLGCPRSGTTLVAELLRDSPWGSPVETHFITKYQKQLNRFLPLEDRRQFERLVRRILNERAVMQWQLDLDPGRLYESLDDHDYPAIVDAICRARAERIGKSSWGDKTPHYILDLPLVASLFPEARFVHVVRDGRDVALSLLERPWGPANVYCCATYWRDCVSPPEETVATLRREGRYHEIRYEDLLATPEREVRQLFDFLGQALPAAVEQALPGIRSDNTGKWRSRMSAAQIRLFESVAADELRRFGYFTNGDERAVSAVESAAYRTHDFLEWGLFMFRQNVIDGFRIRYLGKQPFAE